MCRWAGSAPRRTKALGISSRLVALPFLLLFSGFVLLACETGEDPPTSEAQDPCLVLNGRVLTGASADPAQAVAIRGPRIAAVGTLAEVEAACGEVRGHVELADGVVMPGLTDHHVHLLNVGLSVLNRDEDERLFMDLAGMTSLEELADRLARRAEEAGPGDWILGKGWEQGAWGTQQLPDRGVLDIAVPDLPVFLTRTDGHAGWANGAALRLAGLLDPEVDVPGGAILRREDGELTGVLLERAVEPVVERIPPVGDADVRAAFRLAAEELAARGVTRAFDAGFLAPPGVVALNLDLERLLGLLVEADRENPLPIDVHLMIPAPSDLARRVTDDPDAFRSLTPRVDVTHLKLYVDGALGSRGGWLTHPYADDPGTRGVPRMTVEEILTWARRALAAGLDVAVHAIGDEAVRQTLDAFQLLREEAPNLDPARLRIEHFSYALEEDFRRAVALEPVLSIQSNFNSPADLVPSFAARRVGPEGEDRVYAWRRLHDAGAPLAEGSDAFNLPGPPLWNFHAALTTRNGLGSAGPGPEGRMEAFRLQVRHVHPHGEGIWEGRIEPGAPADLVVLSADPLTAPDDALLDVAAQATFRAGTLVHHDGSLPGIEMANRGPSGPSGPP